MFIDKPFLAFGVLVALVAAPGSAAAQPGGSSDTLRLHTLLAEARITNPGLIGSRLRADAASARISQAGALPDPQVSFALMNRPIGTFGTGERMTMNQVQVTQMIPWPGKLGLNRERARRLATAEGLSAREAEAQLLGRIKGVYYELASIDRSITITLRTRNLLRDFFQVSEARYAVGEGLQQDVLQAQVAIARMTEELTVMEQERVAMSARLNALRGREPSAPVGALELGPPDGLLPGVDSLFKTAAALRPALLAAEERTRAAETGYQAARREIYPDLIVSLGYGQRPQFDDMATVMVGFSLPLRPGSRQYAMRREMAAMRESEEAMARDLTNETFAMLTEQRALAERARELSRLYSTSILPQARAAVESALSAYRVGRVDYMTLVESEMTVNRYEIELVRLAARYHQAVAEVEALLGNGGDS